MFCFNVGSIMFYILGVIILTLFKGFANKWRIFLAMQLVMVFV